MAAMIVLFVSLLAYRGLGAAGLEAFASWQAAARFALATMFVFTASAHFAPMRSDLIRMVPASLPRPGTIVFVTGVLELLGAAGLLFEATRQWAAWGLIALLAAMFPANVSAVRRGVTLRGRPPAPLWIRAPMQVLFITWSWWVA